MAQREWPHAPRTDSREDAAAAKLRFVDLRGLFAAFRGLEGVDAQVATASAQTAQTVTRAAPRLALGR